MTETQSRAVFVSLLGPLALTGAFGFAAILRAPEALLYLALAIVGGAWIAFAFWVTRGREGALARDVLTAEHGNSSRARSAARAASSSARACSCAMRSASCTRVSIRCRNSRASRAR
jgi:hypothetical protein